MHPLRDYPTTAKETFTFEQVLPHLKEGKKIRRVRPEEDNCIYITYAVHDKEKKWPLIKQASRNYDDRSKTDVYDWKPTCQDLLATDWVFF